MSQVRGAVTKTSPKGFTDGDEDGGMIFQCAHECTEGFATIEDGTLAGTEFSEFAGQDNTSVGVFDSIAGMDLNSCSAWNVLE